MNARGTGFALWTRFGAILGLALLLSACVSTSPRVTREYDPDAATRIFVRAYENIFDKYVQTVSPMAFAFGGIEGLSEIDDTFAAEQTGQTLRISLGDETLAQFPIPSRDDITGWAQLTTLAIDATRARSAPLRTANAEDIYTAVLNGALEDLDRHSRYAGLRSARDYRAQREGFGGIGVRLNFDHGLPQIIAILPDTPAEHSALQAGDTLIDVDGKTLQDVDRNTVIWRLRGEVGSEAVVHVIRKNTPQPIRVALRRALIVSQTVHLTREGNIAVISLTGFNQRTARNLNRLLNSLTRDNAPRTSGIVLDMRGNPGGLLDQAVAVADSFLPRGRIVSTRGRHPDSFQLFNASGRDLTGGLPVVVLINGQSASAAEIVAAALQDRGRAVVVGSNSYGKGTVQNITRLPNEGELILTWARFHAPSGYALENLGVMPNFCTAQIGARNGAASVLDAQVQESSIVLTAWRTHSGYDAASGSAMRARCPRVTEKPARDIAIALQVLADKAIYARATAASIPSVARSPQTGNLRR